MNLFWAVSLVIVSMMTAISLMNYNSSKDIIQPRIASVFSTWTPLFKRDDLFSGHPVPKPRKNFSSK